MKKEKTYQIPEEPISIAAEPMTAYGYTKTGCVQTLRNRIVNVVNETDDENQLMECLEMLHAKTMPCIYTDKEFEKIVRKALTDSMLENKEVEHLFEEWEC